MSQIPRSSKPHRKVERWIVGVGMGIMAWIIERQVVRAIRRKGEKPARSLPADPKKKGLAVSPDEIRH